MSTTFVWTPPRLLAVFVALTCVVLSSTAVEAADDELFGLTKIHQLRLTIDAKEHAAMEPTQGGFPGM
ncbi:MAG TPA: hypothetical protein PLV92_05630, partial [Pirellulaceae bacterium]|nr:hypothetical protein [Pirellulaceae bacterium]